MNTFIGGRVLASPAARSLAAEKGVDLSSLSGSGPNGRIVLNDVEQAKGSSSSATRAAPKSEQVISSSSSPDGEYEDIPNTNIRKVIASRLTESKQTIPHYYLTVEFSVDKLQEFVNNFLIISSLSR